MPVLRGEEVRGDTISAAGLEVTPVAAVTRIAWRGLGVEWRRPRAVEIRAGETVRRLPIHDVSRRVAVGIILASVAATILGLWVERSSTSRRSTP